MYTVIVADDEEELRKALICKVNWEEVGFQVIGEAENGTEALELMEKLEPYGIKRSKKKALTAECQG